MRSIKQTGYSSIRKSITLYDIYNKPNLYTCYRSTSAYRASIALALKHWIPAPAVNLIGDGKEHHKPEYLSLNPQGRVPALKAEAVETLIQSPAIIEYIKEQYPTPALLPEEATERAKRRAIASIIGSNGLPPGIPGSGCGL